VPAEPLSHPSHVANSAVKRTPDTYSGVAVVAIEPMESVRSVREPSRMPASTPISSDSGTITTITQNMSMPVAFNASGKRSLTVVRNAVEQPKSPCSTPE
jgi:hypothetical protein